MNAPLRTVTTTDRRRFIGGSDAAVILGVSPWKTPLQLYEQKIAEERAPEIETPVLRRGKRWEPIAREMLVDALQDMGHDVEVLHFGQRYVDPTHDYFASEIDVELRLDGEHVNGELKTVHPFKAHEWGEEGSEEVPIHYAAQSMWGLGITSRQTCIVGALFGADQLVPFKVLRDDETIAAMREKSERFWTENVLARVPPPPSNMADIMALFAKTNGKPVELDDAVLGTLQQLRQVRERIKAFEEEEERLAFAICEHVCGQWGGPVSNAPDVDDAVLMHDGKTVATWKKQRGTHLDQQALKAAHPDIIEKFTREHWFRALRFKKS